jgi:hypothetical protein
LNGRIVTPIHSCDNPRQSALLLGAHEATHFCYDEKLCKKPPFSTSSSSPGMNCVEPPRGNSPCREQVNRRIHGPNFHRPCFSKDQSDARLISGINSAELAFLLVVLALPRI